ncbi:MAG TPA: hypothetical protein VF086_09570 [Propionibacteriaceae bacterium]
MAGTMRRVVAGSKSEGERLRRQSVRQEMVETLEAVGISTGGFAGGGSIRDRMSPGLQARLADAEAEEAFQAAKEERARSLRAEQWQERSEEAARRIAIGEAMAAGEDAGPRALRGERLGHQPHEFIELVAAQQDHEDLVEAARQRREFERWQAGQSADTSGDMSAPTARQLEAAELQRARAKRYREREHDREMVARGIRAGVY